MPRNSQNGIARYVGSFPEYHGWVFKCVELYIHEGRPAWVVSPPCPHPFLADGRVRGIADKALEPLGNPEDDAVDVRDVLLGQGAAA